MKKLFFIIALCITFNLIPLSYADHPNCNDGLCTIFKVTLGLKQAQPNGPKRKKKYKKEYTLPGESAPRVTYYETLAVDENTCWKAVDVPAPFYYKVMNSIGAQDGETAQPVLQPAQNTDYLIMANIMQQTLNFDCTGVLATLLGTEVPQQKETKRESK